MVREGQARSCRCELGRVQETAEHDSTSALNIVIEDRVLVAISFKILEGIVGGEILWDTQIYDKSMMFSKC